MANISFSKNSLHDRIRAASTKILWGGIALTILGIAAIAFPVVSTLVATLMVGWSLLFFGAIIFFGAFSISDTGPFFGVLLLGILSIAASIYLLVNPNAGAAALTLVVAIIFSLQGAVEISFALNIRPFRSWVGLLVSGIISVIAAILIAASWPGISTIMLGVLFGVNFLSTGIGYIIVARELKSAT